MRVIVILLIAVAVFFGAWTLTKHMAADEKSSTGADGTSTVSDERCQELWLTEIRACGDGVAEGPRRTKCYDRANERRDQCKAPPRPKPKPKKGKSDEDAIRELLGH